MKIIKIELGPFDVNTYVVISDDQKQAIVIDPSVDAGELRDSIKDLDVSYIVNTHGHFDHIGGNTAVRYGKNAKIVIHKLDADMLADANRNLSFMFTNPVISLPADILIENENFTLGFGGMEFQVMEVPGHTNGSIALYSPEKAILFSGDLIFRGSIGRTDFPDGSDEKMKASLDRIIKLPANTVVYPGHEETFTIGDFQGVYSYIFGKTV